MFHGSKSPRNQIATSPENAETLIPTWQPDFPFKLNR